MKHKGNFPPKDGHNKNCRDLVDTEEIMMRWKEYTELHLKILMNQITETVWLFT